MGRIELNQFPKIRLILDEEFAADPTWTLKAY